MQKLVVIEFVYKNDKSAYLRLSLDNIFAQSFQDFKLLLYIDGPVDAEVDAYLSGIKDERVRILRRAENKALAQSLNDLLNIVMPMGYDYIARMDADDISEVNRFEKQIGYFESQLEFE